MKLYSGLPAGIQRQISFASLRIGLYDTVQEYFTSEEGSKPSVSREAQMHPGLVLLSAEGLGL
jgi:hypothetical protein